MKNAFALSCLIPLIGYSVTLTVQTLGAISIPLPSISAFIGIYVAAGVLTLAFGDYYRQTSIRCNPARRPASRRETIPVLHGLSLTNSVLHAK